MIYLVWIISAFVAVGVGVGLALRLDRASADQQDVVN